MSWWYTRRGQGDLARRPCETWALPRLLSPYSLGFRQTAPAQALAGQTWLLLTAGAGAQWRCSRWCSGSVHEEHRERRFFFCQPHTTPWFFEQNSMIFPRGRLTRGQCLLPLSRVKLSSFGGGKFCGENFFCPRPRRGFVRECLCVYATANKGHYATFSEPRRESPAVRRWLPLGLTIISTLEGGGPLRSHHSLVVRSCTPPSVARGLHRHVPICYALPR